MTQESGMTPMLERVARIGWTISKQGKGSSARYRLEKIED